jgi:hypothetical protein
MSPFQPDDPDPDPVPERDRHWERVDYEYEIWRDDQVLSGAFSRLDYLKSILAKVDPSL